MKKYLKNYKMLLFVVLIAVLELFYFREMLFNDQLFGDVGDGKFCNLTVEHWFRFFQGKDSFREIRMFFPAEGTIAYSDMLMLYAIPYSILRFLGINMFLSYKYILIILHVAGMGAFAYFVRKKLNLGYAAVLIGTIIFGYSNPYVTSSHTQLYGYFLVPFVILFSYNFILSLEDKKKRRLNGILAVLFLDGLFYTSFYVGYFMAVYLLLFILMLMLVFKLRGAKIIKNVVEYLKKNIKVLGGYVIFAIVLLIPFLYLELPVIMEFGSRSWGNVTELLPVAGDIVNVHDGNLLNGWVTGGSERNHHPELSEGFPILIIFAAVVWIVYLIVRSCQKKINNEYAVYLAAGLAFVLGILLILRFGSSVSLWYVIYKVIPGASAIRAVVRFFQFLCIPLAIFSARMADSLLRRCNRKAAGGVIVAVVFAQYIWTGTIYSQWTASEHTAFVEQVPKPPKDCEIMFIKNIGTDPTDLISCISNSMNATIIANRFNLECINGYSGQFPKEFGECLLISSPNYEACIDNWIRIHGLKNVYGYNVTENKWEKKELAGG